MTAIDSVARVAGKVSRMHETTGDGVQKRACDGASVAVVITTFNDAQFLPAAIDSVLGQTHKASEIIVVDDGSNAPPDLSRWPQVRLIQKKNGGLASARNAGLHAASSEFILFLDADDRLRERAIELNLQRLSSDPSAGMCYGAYINVDADLRPFGEPVYVPCAPAPLHDFYRYNTIGMHAAVLYKRRSLLEVGGFDASLRLCEDYDAYFRMARRYGVVSHDHVVAEYRRHAGNISNKTRRMLRAALDVHARYKPSSGAEVALWKKGRREWRRIYLEPLISASLRKGSPLPARASGLIAGAELSWHDPKSIGRMLGSQRLRRLLRRPFARKPSPIQFGSFSQPVPISSTFGFDRGQPIDRYYIERFLAAHASEIKGRVLEIGDATYSKRFGGQAITSQDVLHANEANHPDVTIVGDLQDPRLLPSDAYDCIVFTQTLHLLYDFHAALKHLHDALKPGGVLLATVPGISQIDRGEWGDTWYWSFTPASIRRMFSARFASPDVDISVDGNVYAATAFLQGLAVADVDVDKLQPYDSAYPVIIGVCARKAAHASV
jgi:glycosyltransferase involved in cell wall biosynthesis